MNNSKFIRLLKTLDNKALIEFEKYHQALYSGYKISWKVLRYIKRQIPHYSPKHLEKQIAFKRIFKTEEYNYRKITDALSDLYLVLKEFLVWKQLKADHFQYDFTFARILKERNLSAAFFSEIGFLEKELNNRKIKDSQYYLDHFWVNYDAFFHAKTNKLNTHIESLNAAMNYLDLFFISMKLKIGAEMTSRANIVNENNEVLLLEQVLDLAKEKKFNREILIQAYSLLLQLIQSKDIQSYEKLKRFLIPNLSLIDKTETQILIVSLINFAAYKIREGHSEFYQEAFDWYQLGLETETLFEIGSITPTRFINIVDTACKLEKYDWASQFIREREKHLPKDMKTDTTKMALARIAFSKNEFETTIAILSNTEFKDVQFSSRARALIIRCYYELEEDINLIFDYANAFEKFIKRSKTFSQKVKNGYLNLIKMIRYLIKENKSKQQLLAALNKMDELICSDWVRAKIETRAG